MLRDAKEASERFAREGNVKVFWDRLWQIEPVLFAQELVSLCDSAIVEACARSHRLPSGPLHDAAKVARAGVPMLRALTPSHQLLVFSPLAQRRLRRLYRLTSQPPI